MPTTIKDLEDKIGSDKVEEIIEKDWKVAEMPSEEELAAEKPAHPKARSNPNSRKNLAQYNKRSKEAKEKAIDNLKVKEVEEDISPSEIFGEDVDPSIIEMFDTIIRPKDILISRAEQETFWSTIKLFLRDFDVKELSFSDFDDIANIAKNKVIENRILKVATKSEKMILEASATLEKYSKDTDKRKSNLASRRVDRIDTKNKPAFSIVELASHLDEQNKLDFERRAAELEKAVSEYSPPPRDEQGNLKEG